MSLKAKAEYVGQTFRVVASALRIQRNETQQTHREIRRPRVNPDDPGSAYTDSVEEPTLLTIKADDEIDVASLIQAGGLVPYDKPKRRRGGKAKASRG